MRHAHRMFTAALLVLLPLFAGAEQAVTFGDYTIHYNALPTDTLEPEVARAYRIPRSRHKALLTISVLKRRIGLIGQPVHARVNATATNLAAQLREIELREIDENGAIYYIGVIDVDDEDLLRFRVEVTPEGLERPFVVEFEQRFFTD